MPRHFNGRTLLDRSCNMRRIESHHTKTTTSCSIVLIRPGASWHLPHVYARSEANSHLHRRTSRAAQPKLASNPSATTGDGSDTRAARVPPDRKRHVTHGNNRALFLISELANHRLAAHFQFTPLGTTVRPHDYLFSTHALQLGAGGNTHRRSFHSLWTYAIIHGNLRLSAKGDRLSYTLKIHCARDTVTFTRGLLLFGPH